ncbi:MAG: hypothetical protein ACRC80_03570 [Waterburya sp.]
MSTKCSIAHGDNFHFYRECFDEENVYLQLEGIEFTASQSEVTVTIPMAVWSIIRNFSVVDLSLADKTDAELRAMVEEKVDQRIEQYLTSDNEREKAMISLMGSICYGSADLPRNEQIESGMQYYRQTREQQLAIKNQIMALEK